MVDGRVADRDSCHQTCLGSVHVHYYEWLRDPNCDSRVLRQSENVMYNRELLTVPGKAK